MPKGEKYFPLFFHLHLMLVKQGIVKNCPNCAFEKYRFQKKKQSFGHPVVRLISKWMTDAVVRRMEL